MPSTSSAPSLVATPVLPVRGLSAIHHGGGHTQYYYDRRLLMAFTRGDSESHFSPVTLKLYKHLCLFHGPHPRRYVDAVQAWMSIHRFYLQSGLHTGGPLPPSPSNGARQPQPQSQPQPVLLLRDAHERR